MLPRRKRQDAASTSPPRHNGCTPGGMVARREPASIRRTHMLSLTENLTTALIVVIALHTSASNVIADERPPNVVMIVADDQSWTDFGFMGHNVIQTPRLDRLAAESALFPNAYVPTSLCRASLATLLTGLYAHQHKICCNDPPEGVDRALMHPFIKQAPTVPRLLAKAGYRSFQTGKFWEGHHSNAGFTD